MPGSDLTKNEVSPESPTLQVQINSSALCSAYDYISVFGLELGGWTTTQGKQEAMLTQAKIGHCDNVLKSLEENSFQKT